MCAQLHAEGANWALTCAAAQLRMEGGNWMYSVECRALLDFSVYPELVANASFMEDRSGNGRTMIYCNRYMPASPATDMAAPAERFLQLYIFEKAHGFTLMAQVGLFPSSPFALPSLR